MPIIFYQIPVSAPCRAVEMTAEHLGIQLEKKFVDVFSGEQMKPEYLEMNPQHTVPTIDDDGFYLWESRAIQTYLVNKYAPNNPLYPSDPKERAIVDKILYFDIGTLFKSLAEFMRPQIFTGSPPDPEKEKALKKALALFEKLLEKTPYAAGKHITVADYSIISMIAFAEEVLDYKFDDLPKVSAWLQRVKKETPKYKEINEIPLRQFRDFVKSKKGGLSGAKE